MAEKKTTTQGRSNTESKSDVFSIIVAVSNSSSSFSAANWALRNPLGFGPKLQITFLHVANESEVQKGWDVFDRIDERFKLNQWKEKVNFNKVILQDREIVLAIVSYCREVNPQLLVVGKTGSEICKSMAIAEPGCPLIFASPSQDAPVALPTPGTGSCKRISLAVADNDSSRRAFSWLCKRVHLPDDANITLVHGYVDESGESDSKITSKEADEIRERRRQVLKSFSSKYEGKPAAKTALVRLRGRPKGDVAAGIMSVFLRDQPAPHGETIAVAPDASKSVAVLGEWTRNVLVLDANIMIFKDATRLTPAKDDKAKLLKTETSSGHWLVKRISKFARVMRGGSKSNKDKAGLLQLQKRARSELAEEEDWEVVAGQLDETPLQDDSVPLPLPIEPHHFFASVVHVTPAPRDDQEKTEARDGEKATEKNEKEQEKEREEKEKEHDKERDEAPPKDMVIVPHPEPMSPTESAKLVDKEGDAEDSDEWDKVESFRESEPGLVM